jgi:hypothetical protein
VKVAVALAVRVAVAVKVAVAVRVVVVVADGVCVGLGLKVCVGVAVKLGVAVGVSVRVAVSVGVGLGKTSARNGVTVRGASASGGDSAPVKSSTVMPITPQAALRKSAVSRFNAQPTCLLGIT